MYHATYHTASQTGSGRTQARETATCDQLAVNARGSPTQDNCGKSRNGLGWRRGWDSNPRGGFPPTPLAGERLRPLGHLSKAPVTGSAPAGQGAIAERSGPADNGASLAGDTGMGSDWGGALADHMRRIAALRQVEMLLGWDRETQMPPKGSAQRAEQAAAVAEALHALESDPRLADWLAEAGARARGRGRGQRRARRRGCMRGRRGCRRRSPPRSPAPRSRGRPPGPRRARPRTSPASRRYSPGSWRSSARRRPASPAAAAATTRCSTTSSPGRPPPRWRRCSTGCGPDWSPCGSGSPGRRGGRRGSTGKFPGAAQLALARRIAGAFGYDWAAGRLDLAVHPSSSGTGGDVRITTRIDEADPFQCLHATIHEVGHAVYEQGLDPTLAFQPAGAHASMGVHESQSRLFENHFGRSRAFCGWLAPAMAASLRPGLRRRRRSTRRSTSSSRASSAPTPTRCTTTCTSCCASTSSGR